MKISLICPTYKRYDLCLEMLKSVFRGTVTPDTFIIVDNGGGFVEYLQEHPLLNDNGELQDGGVIILTQRKNLGVAAGWNTGLSVSASMRDDLSVVCNDDILFDPLAIETLVRAADGLTGHSFFGTDIASQNLFSCFAIRPSLWQYVGPFDEHFYPAYFEDNDWKRRADLLGVEVYITTAHVTHAGSSTIAVYTPEEMAAHHTSFINNEIYYHKKWGGMPHEEIFETPFNQ